MIETTEYLLLRFNSARDSTLGAIFKWHKMFGWAFQCFILEDEKRVNLVKGETRIPEGRYELKLRTLGELHKKYAQKFPAFHVGMIEVTNVPGRTAILFHTGNTDEDTAGCLLTGSGAEVLKDKNSKVSDSRIAYADLYPIIVKDIKSNPTFLTVTDVNGVEALAVDSPNR